MTLINLVFSSVGSLLSLVDSRVEAADNVQYSCTPPHQGHVAQTGSSLVTSEQGVQCQGEYHGLALIIIDPLITSVASVVTSCHNC